MIKLLYNIKSGGETIEVISNKPRGNLRTIHIENGVKNEV